MHFAPDRTCDLQHVSVDIDVDYPNREFTGKSVNTLSPLRNGIKQVILHAGAGLTITSVKVDGTLARYSREKTIVKIETPPLKKGAPIKVEIAYTSKNAQGRGFGAGGGGWHWIEPRGNIDGRMGFWTQGESEYNSEWAPTWDYPNDLATSETRTTVQADWEVVGNGVLTSNKLSPDKKRRTFEWKMTQPHATYLLTLCGGPLEIKMDKWEGVDLWYVVPKGNSGLVDSSFGNTKDMLSFFSKALGVKYPWPKYAQNAMYDFGGGMENVSATTLPESSLTEARDGWYRMDSLNSHELAHQWFGDLVTCKDWGDAWLNESFATIFQILYFEHSRGESAYQWEIEDAMRSYFGEARRYKRPISTKLYPNADAMFDSHTYPKGGVVLHTLRKQLGDEAFFGSLNSYLTKWRHTPVESAQLRRAFTEHTGINADPFWAQWFEKPGHPVLEYDWTFDAATSEVTVTVSQVQDTADGTPIYTIPTDVGVISGGAVQRLPVQLDAKSQTLKLKLDKAPEAVILDPDHAFLREMRHSFKASELPAILASSPNAPDRTAALAGLLESPTPENLRLITNAVSKDDARFPAFRQLNALGNLAKPELRAFWMKELDHVNMERQTQAVAALAKLPAEPTTTVKLRTLINDKSGINVVITAINALSAWDAKGNVDVFEKASQIKDRRNRIANSAKAALEKARSVEE
jgi:aminopeptidase N